MSVLDILKKEFVGKVIVDSEFSSKGDHAYYESIGINYPAFDSLVVDVKMKTAEGDAVVVLITENGEFSLEDNENYTLIEPIGDQKIKAQRLSALKIIANQYSKKYYISNSRLLNLKIMAKQYDKNSYILGNQLIIMASKEDIVRMINAYIEDEDDLKELLYLSIVEAVYSSENYDLCVNGIKLKINLSFYNNKAVAEI